MRLRTIVARLAVVCVALGAGTSAPGATAQRPPDMATVQIAQGRFEPSWDSLKRYECPQWFRDAKFGIWAHWSAQCVPAEGDWYAKHMYIQGHRQYTYHVGHYGHPSVVGFKDICHAWKAERWNPDRLIALYKRAGAKYFVALANHHCNFDCWDSKYHAWNSVNVGPKKDIVGTWRKAARAQGLRFGVTVHSARAWSWYEVAHGSDKKGPRKGVPYDGALTKADGKGKWWEGLDPHDLYARPHKHGEKPDAPYVNAFFARVKDLIDSHRPDLLYFDDGLLPLRKVNEQVGLRIAAHLYNASAQWHGGTSEAVMNTKHVPPDLRKALVWDIERGRTDRLEAFPWQTDTCIGQWHYRRNIRYKSARTVITTLVDIVSKNGNLLLNVPVRGDGTIDHQEVAVLEALAKWMPINGEAIFGTRPWLVYGEGPARIKGSSFNEGRARPYSARDIRFTTKGPTLYAIALGWPKDRKLAIRSLARLPGVTARITAVSLLGHGGDLKWSHDNHALTIALPPTKPCEHAFTFKIATDRLDGFKPHEAARLAIQPIRPAADGTLTLAADEAELHGRRIRVEVRTKAGNIGFWDNPKDWASWTVAFPSPAAYELTAQCATPTGPRDFVVEVAGQKLAGTAPRTKSWDNYTTVKLGTLRIAKAGRCPVAIRPRDARTWKAINLMRLRLRPVK